MMSIVTQCIRSETIQHFEVSVQGIWYQVSMLEETCLGKWGLPSASDPRAKNTGQRATKGTALTSQSLSPWCDCCRLGSTLTSWRWQDINVGNPLWWRTLLSGAIWQGANYCRSSRCSHESMDFWCSLTQHGITFIHRQPLITVQDSYTMKCVIQHRVPRDTPWSA